MNTRPWPGSPTALGGGGADVDMAGANSQAGHFGVRVQGLQGCPYEL